MIPSDVASRLQVTADAALRPVANIQEITDKLAGLAPGQRLMAEIQALMPNGTYRALINQRNVTLALPFAAKAGDSLELEVVSTDGKLTLAALFRPPGEGGKAAAESVPTTLSRTGQLIGSLFGSGGDTKSGPKLMPTALNGNQPIARSPPASAQDILPQLKQAIAQSGLFYESHQAEWVSGRFDKNALLQEPQGKLPPRFAPIATVPGQSMPHFISALPQQSAPLPPGTLAARLPGPPLPAAPGESATAPPRPSGGTTPQQAVTPSTTHANERLDAAYRSAATLLSPLAQNPASVLTPQGAPLAPGTLAAPLSGPPLPAAPGESATALRPSSDAMQQQAATPLTASAHARFDAAYRSPDTLQTPLTEAEGRPAKTADRAGPPAQLVASPALPLVQQQLEALATQNFVWQGQVWPGQTMRWEIEEEGSHQGTESADSEETASRWRTRLCLTLPSLGEVDAQIRLQGDEITLSLTAGSAETQSLLRNATEALRSQLGEAGLALASLGVGPSKESPSYGPPES